MNKNIIQILAIVCVLFWTSNASAQQSDSILLDLNTALEIALNENPTVKVADVEIQKKEYARKSAYGALLPQVDMIGQYQRAIKRQTVYFDEGFGMGGTIDPTKYTPEELFIMQTVGKMFTPDPSTANKGVQMGRLNVWTAGVNVSLPLVVPSLWKNIQMSEVDIRLAMEEARSSKIDLVNKVTKAYYSLLLANDSYRVFEETYATDSVNLTNILNKLKQGVVPEYDAITADVRLKSIIPNILQAENMRKIAELQLKMLMGVDSDLPISVAGSLEDFEGSMFDTVAPVDTSLLFNTELKQFDLQSDKAQKAYELQKLQFAPTLTSSFNYMYMSQNNDFKFNAYRWDPYSTLGLTLSIPLFNGGQRYNNMKQSELQLSQLQYQRLDLERNLKLAVKNNIDLIQKNIEQVVATQSAVRQAKKGYLITQKRYETGLGTIVDVNAAALAVTNAELQYRNAIYDYLAAKTDLEKVLGYKIDPISLEK
ncbi:MAG: TolC family protein [Petrimonas sp.]|nr:TolC family protein [Petrimonas sp.]